MPRVELDGAHLDAGAQVGSGPAAGVSQRLGQPPGVDGVVVGNLEREPDRGRERRLPPPGLAGAQPVDLEPKALPELQLALERLGLVGVARDEQRPAGQESAIDVRESTQPVLERWIPRTSPEPELEPAARDQARLVE